MVFSISVICISFDVQHLWTTVLGCCNEQITHCLLLNYEENLFLYNKRKSSSKVVNSTSQWHEPGYRFFSLPCSAKHSRWFCLWLALLTDKKWLPQFLESHEKLTVPHKRESRGIFFPFWSHFKSKENFLRRLTTDFPYLVGQNKVTCHH